MALRNAYEAARIAELADAGQRAVKPHRCPKCQVDCLRGDDHDECAMKATVDIDPIDALTETLAILDGFSTYDIAPQAGKTARRGIYVLHYREPWHYFSAVRKYPVLIQHKCRKGEA